MTAYALLIALMIGLPASEPKNITAHHWSLFTFSVYNIQHGDQPGAIAYWVQDDFTGYPSEAACLEVMRERITRHHYPPLQVSIGEDMHVISEQHRFKCLDQDRP